MPDQVNSESPLVRFDGARRVAKKQVPGKIQAREHPFLGYLNLRGDPTNVRFSTAVKTIAGADLPIVPNATARGADNGIYWLGPDEWLIVTPEGRQLALAQGLRGALPEVFFAVTDISSGLTSVVLSGSSVCELLAKDCPLDFDIQSFSPQHCAQSRLAKAPILLRRIDGDGFELVIRRSFAEYFWLWVENASAEYGTL